jgi:hypothetical protein
VKDLIIFMVLLNVKYVQKNDVNNVLFYVQYASKLIA